MKRALSFILVLLMLLSFTSCAEVEHETITQHPGKYLYSLGEEIIIYDIETGDEIASLTIKDCTVVNTEPVTVEMNDGSKNETTRFDHLLFVTYEFTNLNGYKTTIDDDNFKAYDAGSTEETSLDFSIEDPGYMRYQLEANSLLIPAHYREVTLEFRYDIYQDRYTAKIDLNSVYDPESDDANDTESDSQNAISESVQANINKLNDKVSFYRLLALILLAASVTFMVLFICEKVKKHKDIK